MVKEFIYPVAEAPYHELDHDRRRPVACRNCRSKPGEPSWLKACPNPPLREADCPACAGSGFAAADSAASCINCGGAGYVMVPR
jgi:hypothetical protein